VYCAYLYSDISKPEVVILSVFAKDLASKLAARFFAEYGSE
jgi:hypothetical protein